ncbi:MAG: response regulator [Deltaproteobacteria bacterium]|nr:response regulator [Deltaproteobacteria bacterium]
MNEVSCRVFEILSRAVEAKGLPLERMVAGTGVSLATLKSKNARIDWSECCAIMNNLRPIFTDEEYVEIGRSHFRSPMLRFVFVIARLRFTPMGFYRWLNKPRDGAGNQLFTCIVPTHRDLSPTECEVDLLVQDGYEVCWEFFTITTGNFMELPRLLGYPPAKVSSSRLPRGSRFHITVPTRAGLLTRVRRAITWPFTVRAAARELQEAHETLTDRFAQLQTAQGAIEAQRALLDTAYRFGQRIWTERDPRDTAQAIVGALVEIGGFSAAALTVAPSDRPDAREVATAGTDPTGAVLALPGQGRLVGELALGTRVTDADQTQTLLDLLVPTIALALDNAFATRAIADYQKNLEAQVQTRTSELRAALDKVASTVRALEDARDARERIFANISHEIRTPLSLILLTVADLEGAGPDGGRAASAIETSARKLLRLVDELLLLAAGQAHGLNLRVESLDITALVTALASAWRQAAQNAGLELSLVAEPGCIAIADPTALDRIVANLVSNAIKFTPRGGHLALEVARAGAAIAITVRDDGRGIDDDLLARLFGRFEQARGPSANRGGSGIGLSLVKELAVALGGDVTVSRLAPGTAFTVTLPATSESATAVRVPELRPSDFGIATPTIASGDVLTPPVEPGRTLPTILIAEDDPALATSIARVLGADHTIVVALDGQVALELASKHQPHLLITDVEMPGLDGVELTRRFRALPGNGLAPVLILSARADLRDRVTGLDAGAIDYIVKPFEPHELRARVRAQLEMRNLALRLHRTEKLAALGSLSAGLAHELRNPANGIVNAIAPLRELLPPELARGDAPTAQLLDVLAGCAEQIAFLSKQLLGFRRGGELELKQVPLADVIERALTLLRPSLKGIELRQHLTVSAPIRCAAPLLVQVITNLVENGIHAAGSGGWVEIASTSTGSAIQIEVADSGPGVPLELRERIFEPFFTTKPPGAGTGLGLAVARDIVQRHGGILEVRARGGRTVFAIDLPQRTAPEPS